jgi:hypothetical protein
MLTRFRFPLALALLGGLLLAGTANAPAQTQPAQTPAPAQAATDEPIGNVATLTGSATVTRNNASTPIIGEFHARRHLQRRHHLQPHRQRENHHRQLCV